jgi:hypothetical protein
VSQQVMFDGEVIAAALGKRGAPHHRGEPWKATVSAP